ncbi:MAG: mechanosensitive ion channel family protein, partial [Pygmaiobacter sp.]
PLLLNQCFRTGYVLLAAWIFCNLVDLVPLFPQRDWSNAESVKKILRRILKVLILSFAVVIALCEFVYNVNGLIAGLGLGGLTLSLAAKDSAANLFSGFLLLVERPFEVGDWITCTAAEGTVEDISFRSTTIRTFANTVSLVPNSVLCASPITNVTRMKMRLVKLTLGVCYGTPRAKLEALIAALRGRLAADADIVPDTAEVRLSGFEESHLSILVLFYTKTTAYREWLAVTERLNFEILECMEQSGVDFAFPTRTVYLGDTAT